MGHAYHGIAHVRNDLLLVYKNVDVRNMK